jgi:hypothetical protein
MKPDGGSDPAQAVGTGGSSPSLLWCSDTFIVFIVESYRCSCRGIGCNKEMMFCSLTSFTIGGKCLRLRSCWYSSRVLVLAQRYYYLVYLYCTTTCIAYGVLVLGTRVLVQVLYAYFVLRSTSTFVFSFFLVTKNLTKNWEYGNECVARKRCRHYVRFSAKIWHTE